MVSTSISTLWDYPGVSQSPVRVTKSLQNEETALKVLLANFVTVCLWGTFLDM